MAGICNANFSLKLIPYGFDMVTLGGFNIDKNSIIAGKKIIQRGRKEFDVEYDRIIDFINNEAQIIKDNNSDVKVSVNLRSSSPERIIEVSNLEPVDVVEINCHCRQKEFLDIGLGQAMLKRSDLESYIIKVVDNANSEVSVKIRANVDGVNTLNVSKLINDSGVDYLHVDAMKPNVSEADLDLISKISRNTDVFLIGNNSIDSLDKAQDMLNAGADGISIARAALNGSLDFNLNEL